MILTTEKHFFHMKLDYYDKIRDIPGNNKSSDKKDSEDNKETDKNFALHNPDTHLL